MRAGPGDVYRDAGRIRGITAFVAQPLCTQKSCGGVRAGSREVRGPRSDEQDAQRERERARPTVRDVRATPMTADRG